MKSKKGFTLIELMVVMAIIAVLSVLIIGAISIARKNSVETANRGTGKTIQTGMEAYYTKNKAYPASGTFNALATGALASYITIPGAQCMNTTYTTYQGGGSITTSGTGYMVTIADNTCNGLLETW